MSEDAPNANPGRTGKGLQFGCGALVGALLGLFGFAAYVAETAAATVLITVVFSVAFGFLAARYGDRFWKELPFP
jgi:hypothetical protein